MNAQIEEMNAIIAGLVARCLQLAAEKADALQRADTAESHLKAMSETRAEEMAAAK